MADNNTGTFLDIGSSQFARCSTYLTGAVTLLDANKRINPEAFQCLFLFSPNPFLNGRKPIDVEYNLDCAVEVGQLQADVVLREAVRAYTGNPSAEVKTNVVRDFLFDMYRAADIDAKTDKALKDQQGFNGGVEALAKLVRAMLSGGEGWPRAKEQPLERAAIERILGFAGTISSVITSFIPKVGGPAGVAIGEAINFLIFIADFLAEYRAAYAALAYRLTGNQRYEAIANAYAARFGFKPSTYTVREWCRAGGVANPDLAPDGTTTGYLKAVQERRAILATLATVPGEIDSKFTDGPSEYTVDGAQAPSGAFSGMFGYDPTVANRFFSAALWSFNQLGDDPMPLWSKANTTVVFAAYTALYAAMLGVYSRDALDGIIKGLRSAGKDEEAVVASMANLLNANACGLTADGFPKYLPSGWSDTLGAWQNEYRDRASNTGRTLADPGTPIGCPNYRLWMPWWEDTAGGNFDLEANPAFPHDLQMHLRRIIASMMFFDQFNARQVGAKYWGSCSIPGVNESWNCANPITSEVIWSVPAKFVGDVLANVDSVWKEFAKKQLPESNDDVRRAFITYFFHVAQPNRAPLVNELTMAVNEWAAQNGVTERWRAPEVFSPLVTPLDKGGKGLLDNSSTLMLWLMTGNTVLPAAPVFTDSKFGGRTTPCPSGNPEDFSCLPCDVLKDRRPVGLPELTVPMELTWSGVKGVRGSPEYAAWVKLFTDKGYPSYYIDCTFRDVKLTAAPGAVEPPPPVSVRDDGTCPVGYQLVKIGTITQCRAPGSALAKFLAHPVLKTGNALTSGAAGRLIASTALKGAPEMLDIDSLRGIQRPIMVELAGRKK